MSEPRGSNDTPAPRGYVFIVEPAADAAHLAAADEETMLPVCGAGGSGFEEFTYLPPRFRPCGACMQIVDEASSRPV